MKNLSRKWFVLFAVLMAAVCLPGFNGTGRLSVAAAETSQADGLVKEGKKVYFYKNGTPVMKTWKTVKKKTYYFGEDGAAVTGWQTVKKSGKYKLFWFSKKGVLNKKKSARIDQKRVNTVVKKSDAIIKALEITSETETEETVKRLFDYMVDKTRYARDTSRSKAKGWEYKYAKKMLSKRTGSCYHYAAGFAFLVRRATGLDVRVCMGKAKVFNAKVTQPHAWTEIKLDGTWYIFDTNAAKYSTRKGLDFYQLKRSASAAKKNYKTSKKVTVRL